MIALGGAVAYGMVALCAARLTAGHLAYRWWENAGREPWDSRISIPFPSGGQWLCAAVTGLLVGAIWPTLGVLWLMRGWAVGAERDHRIAQRDKRIRELEKELNVR